MRVTPTKEQMVYLISIGVPKSNIAQPNLVVSNTEKECEEFNVQTSGPSLCKWLIVLIIILFFLVSLTRLAHGEEVMPDPTPEPGLIEGNRAPTQQNKHGVTPQTQGKEQRLEEELRALIAETKGKMDLHIAYVESSTRKLFSEETQIIKEELNHQRKNLEKMITLLVILGVLAVGLLFSGWILMEKRIRQIERNTVVSFGAQPMEHVTSHQLQAASATCEEASMKHAGTPKVRVEPKRPQERPLPSPSEKMRDIINAAEKLVHIRVKPQNTSRPWSLGLATAKGNVRSENQDYGLCLQTDRHDVLIVADGCGGIPHGQRAAYLAAVSAAVSVLNSYGRSPLWYAPHVKNAAEKAIRDAAHRLTVEGDKLNVTDINGGLRTTLIVVVGNKREIGYAYIGDGGGCIIRSSGEIINFLEPQKANEFAANVLAASLGPMIEGEPIKGLLKRESGDLLIIGTDGVFDRVDEAFPKDVLRACIHYKGDLQKASEQIIDELASFQDSAGYICDDNLTLGIVGDGSAPKLSFGFWSPAISKSEENPARESEMDHGSCLKEVVK